MEKVSVFIKIRVLFWPEISALGVFFNFDNERMRPPKYPSAPPGEEYQQCKRKDKLLFQVLAKPYYLTWWVMSDVSLSNMEQWEIMARLVCDTNLLRASDVRLKRLHIRSRFCDVKQLMGLIK